MRKDVGLLFAMTRRRTFQLVQAAISGFLLVAVTIDLLRGPRLWGGVGGILLQLFLIVSLLQAYDDRRRNPTGYQRPPVGNRLLPLLVAQGYYPCFIAFQTGVAWSVAAVILAVVNTALMCFVYRK